MFNRFLLLIPAIWEKRDHFVKALNTCWSMLAVRSGSALVNMTSQWFAWHVSSMKNGYTICWSLEEFHHSPLFSSTQNTENERLCLEWSTSMSSTVHSILPATLNKNSEWNRMAYAMINISNNSMRCCNQILRCGTADVKKNTNGLWMMVEIIHL